LLRSRFPCLTSRRSFGDRHEGPSFRGQDLSPDSPSPTA
jgi:hypothetical protein